MSGCDYPIMSALHVPESHDPERRVALVTAYRLTHEEVRTIEMIAEGRSSQEIADTLACSLNTVRNRIESINTKLHTHSKLSITVWAVTNGII